MHTYYLYVKKDYSNELSQFLKTSNLTHSCISKGLMSQPDVFQVTDADDVRALIGLRFSKSQVVIV